PRRASTAIARTGRQVPGPSHDRTGRGDTALREIIAAAEIGEVVSVLFEWVLDTSHGADYFRRWHRDKANSGGLFVHKSSHHFDLVNWRSEEHTSELQSRFDLVCRLLLEKKKKLQTEIQFI